MAFCRHDHMGKHKTNIPKNARNTVCCRVPLVSPHDPTADRELWLLLPRERERVRVRVYEASLGKDQNSKYHLYKRKSGFMSP